MYEQTERKLIYFDNGSHMLNIPQSNYFGANISYLT